MVPEILENLRERPCSKDESVEFFIIDNCCKWRNKIHETFGPNVNVRLDLFHAVQRITKTISKQHHFYSDCVHDLSNVFRWDDNIGKNKRKKPTPDSSTLLRNLDRFSEKWRYISFWGSFLRESFQEQINNFRQHITGGCLSGIPVGYSTSVFMKK